MERRNEQVQCTFITSRAIQYVETPVDLVDFDLLYGRRASVWFPSLICSQETV